MPSGELVYFDVGAVLAIHAEALAAHGGRAGLRDRALLESAVAAPPASFAGKPLLSNAMEIGAACLFYLSRNHPFVDGNKRTALAACLVFLQANGAIRDPDAPGRDADAWERLILDVAGSREDREGLTRRLRALLKRSGARAIGIAQAVTISMRAENPS